MPNECTLNHVSAGHGDPSLMPLIDIGALPDGSAPPAEADAHMQADALPDLKESFIWGVEGVPRSAVMVA